MSEQEPWSELIQHGDIEWLYAQGINRWGGAGSKPQAGCVEAALGAAYNAELYALPENDPEEVVRGLHFSVHLLFYLTKRHCYMDGNKRISWACFTWVLLKLGLTVAATTEEAIAFVEDIAKGVIKSAEQAMDWVADRLVPIQ